MRRKFITLSLCLSCMTAISIAAYMTYAHSHGVLAAKTVAAASSENTTSKTASSSKTKKVDSSALTSSLAKIIASNSDISTAVSLIDLDSGQQINAGLNDTVFRGASTTKVLTAAAYLHSVEQGGATLDQYIDGDTANNLIQRMIENSDNDAWYALNDYLGYDTLQSYGTALGMTNWTAYPNTLTAADEATLLAKLYQGKLLNASNTKLLLSYMENSDNQDLIAAALPSSATLYHKYGELEGELHDAAIIKYNGHTFALVIFTNNEQESLDDYTSSASYIQELTAAVINTY
ncbi:MAG TPA: serine hydrolase [Patescibacteria group bacterium]|nr:serine hydrolase [Patescibacteria group bacterium]